MAIDKPSNVPVAQPIASDHSSTSSLDTQMTQYSTQETSDVKTFLQARQVTYSRTISDEQYNGATNLSAGVAGAKKITLEGQEYVIKTPNFTTTFKENYTAKMKQKQPIEHRHISESDDSFAHFPRKEVIGSRLYASFGLDVPETTLVKVGRDDYASLQKFVPDTEATVMNKKGLTLQAKDIEFKSSVRAFLCGLATENIDQHSGNILLKHLPEDEDADFSPDYAAVPIDYGLIFPRHDSVYPKEMNLVKKGIYGLIENKNINFQSFMEAVEDPETTLNDPELRTLMTDQEKANFTKNVKAMKLAAQKTEDKITPREFFDLFIAERQQMGRV